MFLRGLGGESAGLGQAQIDTMRPITGSTRPTNFYNGNFGVVSSGAIRAVNQTSGNPHQWGASPVGRVEIEFNSALLGPHFAGSETRPVNIAVRYLIRAAL